jgi:hypothetical protein
MKNRGNIVTPRRVISPFGFLGCSLLALIIGLSSSLRSTWDYLCLLALIGFVISGVAALIFEKKFLIVLPSLSHFRAWFLAFVIFLFLPLLQTALYSGQFYGFFRTDAPFFIFGIASLLFFASELITFLSFSGLCHLVPIQKKSFKIQLFSRHFSKLFISSFVFLAISLLGISGSAILSPEGRLNGLAIEVSQKASQSSSGYSKASVTDFSDKTTCSELVDSFAQSTYFTSPLFGVSAVQEAQFQPTITIDSFQSNLGVLSYKTFSTHSYKTSYVNDSTSLKFIGLNASVSSLDVTPICLSSKSSTFFRDSLGLSSVNELIGKSGSLLIPDGNGAVRNQKIQIVNICDGSTKIESFYSSCYGNFGIVPRPFFETLSLNCVSADFPIPSAQAYARDVCKFLISKVGSQYSQLVFSYEISGVFVSDEKTSGSLAWLCQSSQLKNGFGIACLVGLFSFEVFAFVFLFSSKDRDYELTLGDSFLLLGVSMGSVAFYFLILYLLRLTGTFGFLSSTLLLPVLVLAALLGCLLPCFVSLPWTAKGK